MTDFPDATAPEHPSIALQLYSVRESFAAEPQTTLQQVADLGFDGVEWFGGLWNRSPGFWRTLLRQTGLSLVSAHVDLDTLESETDAQLDLWESLDCRILVVPYLSEEQREEEDVYERVGERLDLIGYRLRARGFRLAYHNHDFELRPGPARRAGGNDGIRQILSRATHDSISAELDVFWLAWAGADPASYLREIGATPRRVCLVHLKDGLLPPLEERAEVPYEKVPFRSLGQGDLDLPDVIEAALDCGVESFVIEQDFSEQPPLEAAEASLGWLREQLDETRRTR